MPNRLADTTSPYLLQHANNPVDWYPWGAEAFERARREEKPIFLSIGYAACHWCHVMEHLVFERTDIAAYLNAHFISIKVDREERPDLDDLYMMATQMMTGQGGWPMSVWLTPSLKPFYAGTYFPPDDAHGRPGFPRLLKALADAWQNRRAALLEQAGKVVEAIRVHADESQTPATAGAAPAVPLADWLRLSVEQATDRFDDVHGGLGGAPKFPPHQHLQLWLALVARADGPLSPGECEILAGKVVKTLDGMMNGGIYDHIGGGFARYSTDEQWLVPHFEKMLYDNAQLAPLYAHASLLFDRPDYARVARETLGFFLREMMSPAGAFYSSLDADSEGAEGKYYVWTLDDVRAALPDADDAARVIAYFGLTADGNWPESPVTGGNVLAVPAAHEPTRAALEPMILKMRRYRARRERPRLDDKVLTSWNGLMLSALALCGSLLKDPALTQAAQRLADFLLAHHRAGGQFLRVSRGGPAHTDGFLDDYAFLLNGLMDLAATAGPSSVEPATTLAQDLLAQFNDPGHGGFYFTGPRHEQLFARMKNAADNATPSPNGVAIRSLLRLAGHTQNDAFRTAALAAVSAFHPNVARRPEYFPTLLLGLLEDTPPERLQATAQARAPKAGPGACVKVAVEEVQTGAAPLEFVIRLRLEVAEGFHIQPAELPVATPDFIPTTVRVRVALGDAAITRQQWRFPPPQTLGETTGYAGTIAVEGTIVFGKLEPGALTLHLALVAQPCTAAACLMPETVTLEIPLDCRG